MIEEVTEEEAEPVLSKDFVSNTSANGKVHCVTLHILKTYIHAIGEQSVDGTSDEE